MMLQQKKVLSQFELHQQIRLESLKQKLLGLHHLETELENQLRVNQDKMIHRSEPVNGKTSVVLTLTVWQIVQIVRVSSLAQFKLMLRFTTVFTPEAMAQTPETHADS